MAAAVLGLLPLLSPAVGAATACHLHPPADNADAPILIGPFIDRNACETERSNRYGAAGRCHCMADFTPAWLPVEPDRTTPTGRAPVLPLP